MVQSFKRPQVDLPIETIPEEEERDLSETTFIQPDTPQFETEQPPPQEKQALQPAIAQANLGFSLGSFAKQVRK